MEFKHEKINITHEDDRRILTEIFNGDFEIRNINILEIKKDSVLGNHYHNDREIFYLLEGEGSIIFVDIKNGEREEAKFLKGERIIMAPKIAHKLFLKKGSLFMTGKEKGFSQGDLVKYEIN